MRESWCASISPLARCATRKIVQDVTTSSPALAATAFIAIELVAQLVPYPPERPGYFDERGGSPWSNRSPLFGKASMGMSQRIVTVLLLAMLLLLS